MVHVAIVYHSGFGHTEKVAKYVQQGADIDGVTVSIYKAGEVKDNLNVLDNADAIIFGAPTYMGSASAGMKEFLDASSKKWMKGAWRDKIAAGFTNSGSLSGDKLSTLQQFAVFAAQQAMIWVSCGLEAANKSEGHGGKPDDVNRIGSYLGLMTQSDNADPEHTPAPGDLESAKLFGERVANATKRWVAGA